MDGNFQLSTRATSSKIVLLLSFEAIKPTDYKENRVKTTHYLS
jgi:hypothetical protein